VRPDPLLRVLFVVYCIEAGLFLFVAPWTPSWSRFGGLIPWGLGRAVALAPWFRGLASGFGLVHLLWALHDIDLFLRERRRDAGPASP